MIFSQVNVPPILQVSQFENGNLSNPNGAAGVLAPNGNITAIDPNVVNGFTEQFSLGVQRELPKGVFAEVSYVGNLGRHLLRQPNINQIPFDLNASNQALPDNPEKFQDRHYNYGPLSFDRRHAFVGTYVWSLPRLSNRNAIVRTALGSWQLNGIIRLQTGQEYTVTGNSSIGGRRADFVGGDILIQGDARTINNWVNRAAFTNAPNDRSGNAPVGNVVAPGLQTYNLSVSKNFRIRERFTLRYQTDFFNAFNIANFTGLNTNLASAAFGTLPTAYPPRNIQMQLKLTF